MSGAVRRLISSCADMVPGPYDALQARPSPQ
jgi:hypothetical protein